MARCLIKEADLPHSLCTQPSQGLRECGRRFGTCFARDGFLELKKQSTKELRHFSSGRILIAR